MGVGLLGPAPGTLGALEGLALAWGLSYLTDNPIAWTICVVTLVAIGVPLCTRAARQLGGKDPQPIVWDELSTVPIVFALVPLTEGWIALLGFGLHRLFDITKLWPCRQLERLPEGLGIMADDVAASIYAACALWGVMWVVGLSAG
jgi:phosphatidylglycerophosphatase A